MKTFISFLCAGLLFGSFGSAATAAPGAAKALADRHVERGLTCTACHVENGKTELKAEGGDFGVCASCHGDYQKMIERTASKWEGAEQPNPHSQHDGAVPCTECHKGHASGRSYCSDCHSYNYTMP